MKKILVLLTIFIYMIFSVGCWDYIEYNQIVQIYALGFDLKSSTNEITVTLQNFSPERSKGEKLGETNQGTTYSASALTIIDALTKLQDVTPTKLFYGYLKVIVIGEDAARYIMKDIIALIDRTPTIRNSVNIIITQNKAETIISTIDPKSTSISGKKISMLLESSKNSGSTFPITLNDFTQMLSKKGLEPIASNITSTAPIADYGNAMGGSIDGIRFNIQNQGNIRAFGMAAFKEDKFVGWLDDKETLGLALIKGIKINTYKSTKYLEGYNDPNSDSQDLSLYVDSSKILFFYITSAKSKIIVQLEEEKPIVTVKLKVQATLRKYYSSGDNSEYLTPDIINSMEKKLEESIKSDMLIAIKKVQTELNTDIFGFGFNLYRQHPKEWHKKYENTWSDIFQDIPVTIKVDAKLNNTGTNIKRLITK
jgi:spore germination protein KC